MASWRDEASEAAQADLDGLLNPALGFAQQQLERHGEFYPFAVAVTVDGDVELVDGHADVAGEHPASAEVMTACLTALRGRREQLRAAAVVCDVRLAELGTDAVDVALEHVEGTVLRVQLPYARQPSGQLDYGDLRAQPGGQAVWS